MILTVDRKYKKETYTIGNLYVDGLWFCSTLEDKDRGLRQKDSLESIRKRKVYGETAIPAGTYRIAMNIVSPKYSAVKWYKDLNGGKMPRIMNVPGYEGCLIHPGTTALDTLGCLLVGENKAKGKVLNSRETFKRLYAKMREASERGETITLKIG